MTRIFASLLVLVTLGFAPAAMADEAPLSRSDVETIVREYLLANPEVLEEAFAALQTKRQEEAAVARTASLELYRDALETSEHGAVLGNPNGDVTLVEFFDYNCGYCRRAMDDLDRLIEGDPNLRVVLKEFPVLGQSSMEAAAVSIAVLNVAPDAYAEFHDRLLGGEGQASEDVALQIVSDMKLPRDQITELMRSDKVRDAIQESYEIAQALGLSGTPSYVIGDNVEFGAVGYDALKLRINEARCGATSC
ncbi:DsbA family protein [Acuticoccus kandeliae]|uniref:DsbA family protein n=1 Tax=Acuticoccus kandeliae TaxID=2073160 RepID=UPI000D3EBFBE|nr:DsbA family protein [Acuticoccus kandeliae]